MSGTWLSPRSVQARRIMVLAGKVFLCFMRSLWELPPRERNDPTYVHDRDASSRQKDDALRESSAVRASLYDGAGRWVEDFPCLEHGMHDDREFPGDSHCGALEAKPFAQLEPPVFESAFSPGAGSCQHHGRGFVKQRAQMVVASP